MSSVVLVILLTSILGTAQTPPASTGNATTNKDCSPAVTGSNNNFKFSCGVGEEQGRQIIAMLNKLLAREAISAVIRKLDELAKRTNPNATVTTYDCLGNSHVSSKAIGLETITRGLPNVGMISMAELFDSHRWSDLLTVCLAQIGSKPEWLTPRLYCAASYIGRGDTQNARKMIDEYDSAYGPAYNHPFCTEFAKSLRARLP